MKKAIICMLLLTLELAHCQWQPVNNGLYFQYGTVNSLASDGINIFAGTDGYGIYISNDKGNSWRQAGLKNLTVLSIAIDGNRIYAGTKSNGVYSSSDYGSTWHQIGLESNTVYSLEIYKNDIYAGVGSNGAFFSSDNGASWKRIAPWTDWMTVYSFAFLDDTVYAATDHGLFTSTDKGNTWDVNQAGYSFSAKTLLIKDKIIFAGTKEKGLNFSTDYGSTWNNSTFPGSIIFSLETDGTNIYVLTLEGLFVSSDNGLSWSEKVLANINPLSLAVDENNIFIGTTGNGVYHSTDKGVSIEQVSQLYTTYPNINSLAVSGDDVFAGTITGIYKTSNNENNWQHPGIMELQAFAISIFGDSIIVGTGNNKIYLSTDDGENWKQIGYTHLPASDIDVKGKNILVGTWNGLFLSTNGGYSWQKRDFNESSVSSVLIFGDYFFADTRYGLLLSKDFGYYWKDTLLKGYRIYQLKIFDNKIFAGTNDGIYFSSDSGRTWEHFGLSGIPVLSLEIIDENIICVGTQEDGIYISTDKGVSWIHDKPDSTIIHAVAHSGKNIFVGTSLGLYLYFNNGGTWNKIKIYDDLIWTLVGNDTKIIIGKYDDGFLLSTDNGTTWQSKGLKKINTYSIAINQNKMFACSEAYEPNLYSSTDNGQYWKFNNSFYAQINTLEFSGDTVFAGSMFDGVYYSSDNGETWEERGPEPTTVRAIAIKENNIFIGGDYGHGVILSTDFGENWQNGGLGRISVFSLLIIGHYILAGTTDGVYVSEDNGSTWKQSGLAGIWINSLERLGVNIFAGTEGNGVFLSIDYCNNWLAINDGLTNLNINSILICGDNIYAGTFGDNYGTSGDGVFKAKLSDFPTSVKDNFSEQEFIIYPNPANDYLYISYSDKNILNFSLTDLMGRILLEGNMTENRVLISSLLKGVYFIKIGNTVRKFVKM